MLWEEADHCSQQWGRSRRNLQLQAGLNSILTEQSTSVGRYSLLKDKLGSLSYTEGLGNVLCAAGKGSVLLGSSSRKRPDSSAESSVYFANAFLTSPLNPSTRTHSPKQTSTHLILSSAVLRRTAHRLLRELLSPSHRSLTQSSHAIDNHGLSE